METRGRFTIEKATTTTKTKKTKKPRKKDNESLRIKLLKNNAKEVQKKTAIEKVLKIEERINKLDVDIRVLDDTRKRKMKEVLSLNTELTRMTLKYSGLFPSRS